MKFSDIYVAILSVTDTLPIILSIYIKPALMHRYTTAHAFLYHCLYRHYLMSIDVKQKNTK
jgi:hypothetical protein